MIEQAVDIGLAGYASIWATVNAYNFYPEIKRRIRSNEEQPLPDTDEEYEDVDIDLLIPAYDEAEVIEYPLASIEQADQYGSSVNPTVLLEPEDEPTQEKCDELLEEYDFDIEVIPEAYPGEGAKPRALNYGFEQTDGDLVAVFDAEDRLDENFYREVYEEIIEKDHDYAQGILDMTNEDDGWKNSQFRAEYGVWFRNLMHAYDEEDYPVPLGGTTNVFHRETLEELHEIREEEYGLRWDTDDRMTLFEMGLDGWQPWDPENVTEDFELGMLLWEHDYDMTMLDSVTKELSPTDYKNWMTQRTRWQKGKLQTLEQYLEHPPETMKEKAHIYLQSAVPHLGPINASGVALSLGATAAGTSLNPVTLGLMGLGAAGVGGHMLLHADGYRKATDEEGLKKHARTVMNSLTLPVYWGLQWMADGRALKQFHSGNTEWEKTDHEDIDDIYDDLR